jgi:endonuclease III
MKTPKIIFRYSWVYDQNWKEWIKLYPRMAAMSYPEEEETKKAIKKIQKLWRKKEKVILSEIAKIVGQEWQEKEITCYVVGKARGFSDPLTIGIKKNDPEFSVDTLIHELIHQIFLQNEDKKSVENMLKKLEKDYPTESRATRIHIVVHAVHKKIYLKFFSQKRLDLDKWRCEKNPEYKKAWEIVDRDGYLEK